MRMTLKMCRVGRNISTVEAAKACGVHENTIRNWEKDEENIPVKYVIILLKLYGMKFEDIFLP